MGDCTGFRDERTLSTCTRGPGGIGTGPEPRFTHGVRPPGVVAWNGIRDSLKAVVRVSGELFIYGLYGSVKHPTGLAFDRDGVMVKPSALFCKGFGIDSDCR